MALKAVLDSLDAIPEGLREHYKKGDDGKFRLEAEGVEDVTGLKSALEKERNDRKTTAQKLKELTEQLGDLDPVKAREALKKLQELEDKKLIDSGKIDELLAQRTERMQADHNNQVAAFKKNIDNLTKDRDQSTARLSELLIDNALRAAATKAGVKATAIEDAVLWGKQLYRIKDGNPVPMRGDAIVYGKNPQEPMPMEEWLGTMIGEKPHWFEESAGGGAGGGKGKSPGPGAGNKKRSGMTVAEKSQYISEHGRDAYMKLPA